MKLFIISDIHGRFDEFKELLKHKPEDAKLVLLGDLIDRGNKSLEMVRWAMKHKDEVIVLKGNHEDMFCKWYEDDSRMKATYEFPGNGGCVFLEQLWKDTDLKEEADIYRFLRDLPLKLEEGNLLLSHAPYIKKFDEQLDPFDFLWTIKEPDYVKDKVSIHGHTDRYLLKNYDGDNSHGTEIMGKKEYDNWTKELNYDGWVKVKETVIAKHFKNNKLYSYGIDGMKFNELIGFEINTNIKYMNFISTRIKNLPKTFVRHNEICMGDSWGELKALKEKLQKESK